jgi:periplasmic divalent cation tolerance protein
MNRLACHAGLLYLGAQAPSSKDSRSEVRVKVPKMLRLEQIIVLVTCGSRREAEKIARSLVVARLAACVNIAGSPVRSIYRWKGRVENAKEFLVMIKTSRSRFAELRREVQRLHSYDVPEIVALPIVEGSREYLAWIQENIVQQGKQRKGKRSKAKHPEALI